MRKLTAIICLLTFVALQYGKLISYWHCRLITITSSTPCDCVQQLLDVHKDGIAHTTTTVKEKTEEIVLFYEPVNNEQLPETHLTYRAAYTNVIPETHRGSIFRPPQV